MFTHTKRLTGVVGLAAVAATAGALFFGATAAYAAPPPYEPDPNSVGTLTFYDSSGNVITSGRTDVAPFAAYVSGPTIRSGDKSAAVYFAAPDPNKTPVGYFREQVGVFSPYPITSGPANLQALTIPVNTGDPSDQTLDGFRSDLSNPSTAAGYDQVVQVRVRTADASGQIGIPYDVADVKINPTAHTWTQVYPAPTTTTVAATPNPVAQGDTVTLTATEKLADNSGVAAGSVQFASDGSNLGSPVAVDSVSGKASITSSTLAKGSHSITATFVPSSGANGPSNGTTSLVVTAPSTKTVLAVSPNAKVGDDATGTATVTGPGSTPNASGKVDFYDNGSTTPFATVQGSAAVNGAYSFDLPTGFAAGDHSVVATFTPTDPSQFTGSSSTPAKTFKVQDGVCADPGSVCSDTQNIQVTVPTGTLVINTPYTASNPLDLGTMAPNSAGTLLSASKPFQNIVITDLRNGASGYTVSAQSSPLTDVSNAGSTINAQNVGLTAVTGSGGSGFAGTVAGQDNAAAAGVAPGASGTAGLGGAAHTVLTVNGNSRGTVTANGTLTINAPTSTEPGLFTGTITFTVG